MLQFSALSVSIFSLALERLLAEMEETLVVALDGKLRNILKLSSFWVTLVLKRSIENDCSHHLYDNHYKTDARAQPFHHIL